MSANGISTTGTGTSAEIKEARQLAKLDIAQAKRQGKVVAVDGTITGVADDTVSYYRYWNVYDRLKLAGPYNVDEATTTNPLEDHRPWSSNIFGAALPITAPTVNTQTNSPLQPTISGTYDVSSTTFTVAIDGVTYTLGTSPELTTSGSDWFLNLDGSAQTLDPETIYDVVATSDGTITDATVDEVTTTTAINDAVGGDASTVLQVWFDGSDISQFQPTNPSDGDGFTQWNDKSAYAHNANPTGSGPSARPTYETNELNAQSVIRFDGDSCLSVNPFSSLASQGNQTIFIVAKGTSLGATAQTLVTANNDDFKIRWDGTNWNVSTSGGTGVSSLTADANWHIFGLVYDGNAVGDANKLKFRFDKTEQTLDFTADPGVSSTSSGNTNVFYIGCKSEAVEHFVGDVAEILMFDRTLSGTEIEDIEEYLNTHWNLGL